MEELLVRSKQAPLKFHIRPDYLGDRDKMLSELRFVDQVIHHIDRVQELHLFLPPLVEENFFPKLSSPAPRLQDLRISTLFGSSQWELPSVLFDGDTPALRTLQLYNFPVAWYSFKLSSLTTLNLCHLPARFQQNTGELLATLRCMQDLIHLYLHNALASAADFLSSTAFHTFQKFNLPHLSCLSLGAPFSTAAALLSCANIPLKTEVGLKCRPETIPPLTILLCSAPFSQKDLTRRTISHHPRQFAHWSLKSRGGWHYSLSVHWNAMIVPFPYHPHEITASLSRPAFNLTNRRQAVGIAS